MARGPRTIGDSQESQNNEAEVLDRFYIHAITPKYAVSASDYTTAGAISVLREQSSASVNLEGRDILAFDRDAGRYFVPEPWRIANPHVDLETVLAKYRTPEAAQAVAQDSAGIQGAKPVLAATDREYIYVPTVALQERGLFDYIKKDGQLQPKTDPETGKLVSAAGTFTQKVRDTFGATTEFVPHYFDRDTGTLGAWAVSKKELAQAGRGSDFEQFVRRHQADDIKMATVLLNKERREQSNADRQEVQRSSVQRPENYRRYPIANLISTQTFVRGPAGMGMITTNRVTAKSQEEIDGFIERSIVKEARRLAQNDEGFYGRYKALEVQVAAAEKTREGLKKSVDQYELQIASQDGKQPHYIKQIDGTNKLILTADDQKRSHQYQVGIGYAPQSIGDLRQKGVTLNPGDIVRYGSVAMARLEEQYELLHPGRSFKTMVEARDRETAGARQGGAVNQSAISAMAQKLAGNAGQAF